MARGEVVPTPTLPDTAKPVPAETAIEEAPPQLKVPAPATPKLVPELVFPMPMLPFEDNNPVDPPKKRLPSNVLTPVNV